jgi:hypothetical protein
VSSVRLRRSGIRDAPRRKDMIRFTTGLKPDALRMNSGSVVRAQAETQPNCLSIAESFSSRESSRGLAALTMLSLSVPAPLPSPAPLLYGS